MTVLDHEAAYYQAVEEFFVSRRGDPLLLSNADWLLIKRWRSQGVPLRVVLRGITDALDAHAHSWGRRQKVGSLRYCEGEVERARERWERATADGGAPADTGSALEGLIRALRGATGLGPRGAREAERAARRLQALRDVSRPRDAEPELQAAEARMLEAIRDDDPESSSGVEASVDAALGGYRARMPASVFASLRKQSVARELLAAHGLPRLTLFEI